MGQGTWSNDTAADPLTEPGFSSSMFALNIQPALLPNLSSGATRRCVSPPLAYIPGSPPPGNGLQVERFPESFHVAGLEGEPSSRVRSRHP